MNLKDNKKSYDSNEDEWRIFIEDQLRLAIGGASLDILNYTLKQNDRKFRKCFIKRNYYSIQRSY